MFKFGFSIDKIDDNINDRAENPGKSWFKSKEVAIEDFQELSNRTKNFKTKFFKSDNYEIKYIDSNDIINVLKASKSENNPLLDAEQNHSDLISAVYEGGLKIWECTFDLLNYMINQDLNLNGKKILDLGCGAGMIGILGSLKGGTCYFQDYNIEVIESVTIPNYFLNNGNENKSKFFSGDWESFLDVIGPTIPNDDDKFDFIFTSETIYNPDNYPKLHSVFEKTLKKSGIIYIAAKMYYFGVGGGISEFKELLNQRGVFRFFDCWNCSQGVKRSIVKINFL